MASARLYCIVVILYFQGIQGQHTTGNNQNFGVNNNAMTLQQQAMQRFNTQNVNQIQNGGQNSNFQPSFQQNYAVPNANMQTNLQQPFNPQNNMQSQGGSPVNVQILRPQQQSQQEKTYTNQNFGIASQMRPGSPSVVSTSNQSVGTISNPSVGILSNPSVGSLSNPSVGTISNPSVGMVSSPSVSSTSTPSVVSISNPSVASISTHQLANSAKPNGQTFAQPNVGPNPNAPITQISNPSPTSSFADSLQNRPSVTSVMGSQNNMPQQNQQIYMQNLIPPQNQLTDEQKQMLVRSLQSQQPPNMQSQLGFTPIQNQPKITTMDNQQFYPVDSQSYAFLQPIVTPIGNQPAFIPVQAQPLATYLQSQDQRPVEDDDAALLSLILSEIQPSSPQYAIASAFAMPKKGKSGLKALIPLIISLLKERNECGWRNCGCQNDCGNNNFEEPKIFGGYSNQKNYSEKTEKSSVAKIDDIEMIEDTANVKEGKSFKNNTVNVDSEEVSEETDSEYVDDEET